jgi:hypothetical protein
VFLEKTRKKRDFSQNKTRKKEEKRGFSKKKVFLKIYKWQERIKSHMREYSVSNSLNKFI